MTTFFPHVFGHNKILAGDVIRNGTPVVANELMWSLATSAQAAILGHITYSTGDPVAANSIAGVVQQISTVVIMGIANAAAVLVGMAIGENNMEKAEQRAKAFRNISFYAGIIACTQTAPLREIQPDGSRHPFDTFICAKTPAGRWGDPEDMVGPCVFLASHASDFVNGQILYADGGILAYIGKQPK